VNSDPKAMLGSAVQTQVALLATMVDLAGRWNGFVLGGLGGLARAAAAPLRAPAAERQTAIEDGLWAAYSAHAQLLRAAAGAPRLAAAVYLNKLDQQRGPRPVRPTAPAQFAGAVIPEIET